MSSPAPNLRLDAMVALPFALLLLALAACQPVTQSAPPRPAAIEAPRLADYWDGRATFVLDQADTGLPMGESDTLLLPDGTLRSYVHASDQSLGVRDQCGDPVAFPGCLITFTSRDQGRTFAPTTAPNGTPICQMPCAQCPCTSPRDHIDQQQYPRVIQAAARPGLPPTWVMVYEYRANNILRASPDGLQWSPPRELPLSGIWQNWLMPCPQAADIGPHPFAPPTYDCLIGGPPGIFIDERATPPQLYLFVALGQNPSSMGCYRGPLHGPPSLLTACSHNPLFTGHPDYGPPDITDARANAHFDFRTISSAEVILEADKDLEADKGGGDRYYMFYEGVRGPGPGDNGDTQFLLGLARSQTAALDGPWELYPGNPILVDLPGNVGLGHADLVTLDGVIYLYTSLDGLLRSRLRLVWR